ncbi:MAG: GTP-dependent dephospho-CoA kinase family protein [Candidatus Bathyarchaeia archaeon]
MLSEFADRDREVGEDLYDELRKPLGQLVRDAKEAASLVKAEKPRKIIFVGDSVTRRLVEMITPDVIILDNRIMRKPIEPLPLKTQTTIYVANPRGRVSAESWRAIDLAIGSNKQVKVVVRGEEDLLALPAIQLAPEGSIVLYGQPKHGVVVVSVDKVVKRRVRSLLRRMAVLNE